MRRSKKCAGRMLKSDWFAVVNAMKNMQTNLFDYSNEIMCESCSPCKIHSVRQQVLHFTSTKAHSKHTATDICTLTHTHTHPFARYRLQQCHFHIHTSAANKWSQRIDKHIHWYNMASIWYLFDFSSCVQLACSREQKYTELSLWRMHSTTAHQMRPHHFPFIRNICILLQIDFEHLPNNTLPQTHTRSTYHISSEFNQIRRKLVNIISHKEFDTNRSLSDFITISNLVRVISIKIDSFSNDETTKEFGG